MWQRDENAPVNYTGVPFRSGLEANVAREFDLLNVDWAYERGVDGINKYLPDFTILDAPDELALPRWVEVKPAELLYAVRDHMGVPERFTDDITVSATAQQLLDAGLEEIWKPKALAEHEYEAVLVVSKINRNRTLALEMLPEHVRFTRSHPCVCWREVLKERERAARREQWRREAAAREAARAEHEAAERAARLRWVRTVDSRPARYDGWCIVCSQQQPASALHIARWQNKWIAFCLGHKVRE